MTEQPAPRTLRHWLALGVALLVLDASISFDNIWPTPMIRWAGTLSIELGVVLLALAVWHRSVEKARDRWLRWLSAAWVLLAFGHYADVTAPALYGRDINLYWDARFMPDVAAMVVRVARVWQIVLVLALAAAAIALIYLAIRWAFGHVATGIQTAGSRRVVGLIGGAMVAWFLVQQIGPQIPERPRFARSVVSTYGRQLRLAAVGLTSSVRIADSPPMQDDLSLVQGTDVLLVFIESYGAVTFDRPEFASELVPHRAALDEAIRDTHRQVVSAFVESTTFGGSSWLAHISLLSGVEIRDHDANAQLMTEKRDTMAGVFKRHGYRTIAMMPGLRSPWPEGGFYGFDQTYNAERLAYPGPDFGWFAVPDQFSIAWLDRTELAPAPRPPLFVFFPTLSTHFPFSPKPPYQEDWTRILGNNKYSAEQIVQAYGEQLDWVNFGPAYADAVAYIHDTIAGYLRLRPDRDFVMILVGDHQPPAAVSGEGASWEVPMHVITSRMPVVDRLEARGFARGLTPRRPALGRMDQFLAVLLGSFSTHE